MGRILRFFQQVRLALRASPSLVQHVVPQRSILVVLPRREEVASQRAGAVALSVAEFGRESRFRDQLLVIGGAEAGDFPLAYRKIEERGSRFAMMLRHPWRRATSRYAHAVADYALAHGTRLVEVHNSAVLFSVLARRLPAEVPVCLHLHNDPQLMRGLMRPGQRTVVLARAARLYGVSDYVVRQFVDGIEAPCGRVLTLYNGVVIPAEIRWEREKTLLFVGRLIPEKGVDALIEALLPLARTLPDWTVTIVGQLHKREQALYSASLAALAAAWEGRMTLVGFVPHAEVMKHYARAAITLVPSLWAEAFGRVALEAMAAGSAVIASRSGGLPEVVGEAGILLETVTPEALREAILSLARDPQRRTALGRAGRAVVEARFEAARLSGQLDAVRGTLLGSTPGRTGP